MAQSDQFGLDMKGLSVAFPDLKRLESELEQRFGTQSMHCSAEFALTQA